jgi:hypothetical protein
VEQIVFLDGRSRIRDPDCKPEDAGKGKGSGNGKGARAHHFSGCPSVAWPITIAVEQ